MNKGVEIDVNKLARILDDRLMTHQALAVGIHSNRETVSRILGGSRPSRAVLSRIIAFLGIKKEALLSTDVVDISIPRETYDGLVHLMKSDETPAKTVQEYLRQHVAKEAIRVRHAETGSSGKSSASRTRAPDPRRDGRSPSSRRQKPRSFRP